MKIATLDFKDIPPGLFVVISYNEGAKCEWDFICLKRPGDEHWYQTGATPYSWHPWECKVFREFHQWARDSLPLLDIRKPENKN